MALKATIFKADLQIADMDRHYYADHTLTIARHPSETDERMMVRVFAFIRHAHEALIFGKGLSDDDEPGLWQKDLTGAIDLWVEIGMPDERRLLKAAGRAKHVIVYSYGQAATVWWNQIEDKIARAKNISIFHLPMPASSALAGFAQRTMHLQCTIQDGQVWLSGEKQSLPIECIAWREAPNAN
jgi:uncharacterized protein YaeQ